MTCRGFGTSIADMMHKIPALAPIALAPIALAVAACATTPGPTASEAAAMNGQAFAEARCADCHAVTPGQISSNPAAPEFEAVANTQGLTRASLTQWLNNSHDFPREMYFALPEEKVDDLVSYMLTLRREDYQPMVK